MKFKYIQVHPETQRQLSTPDSRTVDHKNRISMEKMHQIYSINPIVVWMFNGQWPNSLPCLVWGAASAWDFGSFLRVQTMWQWNTPMADLRARRWTEPGSREAWCLGITTIRLVVPLGAHRVSQLNPSFDGKNSLRQPGVLLGVTCLKWTEVDCRLICNKTHPLPGRRVTPSTVKAHSVVVRKAWNHGSQWYTA